MLLSILLMTAIQCTKENIQQESKDSVSGKNDSAALTMQKATEKKIQDSLQKAKESIKFTSYVFPKNKKDSAMSAFMKQFSGDERYLILALNRLDNKNRWRADTLAIPQKIETDIMKYTPFPVRLDSLQSVNKMAFFSYDIHAYALYENGNLIKWGPSSLGKKATPTKKGLMFTNWKKEVAISTSNSEWKLRWNFNIHNTAGIGWHQYDLPGFHASHSCLRLLEEDAKWMYSWANTWVLSKDANTVVAKGTPVIVFGDSDFKSKPWLKLIQDPKANDISVEQMNSVFVPHLQEILKEQSNSEEVRSTKMLSKEAAKENKNEKEAA